MGVAQRVPSGSVCVCHPGQSQSGRVVGTGEQPSVSRLETRTPISSDLPVAPGRPAGGGGGGGGLEAGWEGGAAADIPVACGVPMWPGLGHHHSNAGPAWSHMALVMHWAQTGVQEPRAVGRARGHGWQPKHGASVCVCVGGWPLPGAPGEGPRGWEERTRLSSWTSQALSTPGFWPWQVGGVGSIFKSVKWNLMQASTLQLLKMSTPGMFRPQA